MQRTQPLSTNSEDIEALCIEIINAKSKNIQITRVTDKKAGRYNGFEIYQKQFLHKSKNKESHLVGDRNHSSNTKLKDYLNPIFQNFLTSVIKNPTRLTKINATLIDYILTNDFVNTHSSTYTVKSNMSHHFPIFLVISVQFFNNIQNKTTIR